MPNSNEPEITNDSQQVSNDYNPLNEAVNEKAYSAPNVDAGAFDFTKSIDEPRFTPPPINANKPSAEVPPKKREPVNPEMKNLSKKDTEHASAQMAGMILDGYEWAVDAANKGLVVSEKKLNKLQQAGEINLNAEIDYDFGKRIRAGEFFKEYNEQVGGVLKVTPEFKEEVRPVLERVLSKRGIGLTDEQTLMFMFSKDIATKGVIFFQQKAQMNYMIQSIKEATVNQYAPVPPQAAPAPPPPPPPPPPAAPTQPATEPPAGNEYSEYTETKNEQPKSTESGVAKRALKPDLIVAPRKQGRPSKK